MPISCPRSPPTFQSNPPNYKTKTSSRDQWSSLVMRVVSVTTFINSTGRNCFNQAFISMTFKLKKSYWEFLKVNIPFLGNGQCNTESLIKLFFFSQISMQSYEKLSISQDSIVCRDTFSSLSYHCEGILTFLHYNIVWGLLAFMCTQNSLKIPPQHFNRVEFWTFSGSLQHLDSFIFHPFCCRVADVLGIIVLLHDPISS